MKPHKVMTPEEYGAAPIVGWHEVCRNVDGCGSVGVRYKEVNVCRKCRDCNQTASKGRVWCAACKRLRDNNRIAQRDDRRDRVIIRRIVDGQTYKEIGTEFGVCTQRAREIFIIAWRQLKSSGSPLRWHPIIKRELDKDIAIEQRRSKRMQQYAIYEDA